MSGRHTPAAVPLLRHLSVRAEVESYRAWAERIGDPDLLALVAHTAALFERAGWTLEVNAMRSLEALGRARAAWEVKEVVDAAKAADSAKGGRAKRWGILDTHDDLIARARKIQKKNPHLTPAEIARRLADRLAQADPDAALSADWIARLIRPALKTP